MSTKNDGGMTLAMTGATGFLGKRTLSAALQQGFTVRALTRRPQEDQPSVTWVAGALDQPDALDTLVEGADCVLHIAGVVNAPDRAGFIAGNITGTANMLAAAQKAKATHFIHVSSLAAREPGLSVYGWSKAEAERQVVASDLPWSVIRPPGIYGPGDTEMLDMFRMAKRGLVLLPPKGRVSIIHVDDIAQLLLAVAVTGPTRAVWEADDGAENGWSHEDFAHAIADAVGRSARTVAAPAAMLNLAARGDRLVRRDKAKLTPDRARYLSHPDWTVDAAQRPPEGLWTPQIATPEGLKQTARWYREAGWL
ncbi:MAG: NAD-dependent epimerase/dehydratase family protein [Pseudomonadota bacterium]